MWFLWAFFGDRTPPPPDSSNTIKKDEGRTPSKRPSRQIDPRRRGGGTASEDSEELEAQSVKSIEEWIKRFKKEGEMPAGEFVNNRKGGEEGENGIIAPGLPCLTIKYLCGLETTAMERDWLYFDMLSKIQCPIR